METLKSIILKQNAQSEKYVFDWGLDQGKNTCLTEKNKFDDGAQTVLVKVFEQNEELDFAEYMFSIFQNNSTVQVRSFQLRQCLQNSILFLQRRKCLIIEINW